MIIGLTGPKQSGKDTAAKYFVDRYGFERVEFADPLKDAIASLFGIERTDVDKFKYEEPPLVGTGTKPLGFVEVHLDIGGDVEYTYSWREFLQRFGTEMGRNTWGQDFWIRLLMDKLNPHKNYVIPDVRFENEVTVVNCLIEISRPGYGSDDTHQSEAGISEYVLEAINAYHVKNDGTIEDLYKSLEEAFRDYLGARG